MFPRRLVPFALSLVLSACHAGQKSGIIGGERTPLWSGIAASETLHATGTEPFWGAEVGDGTLTWKTADHAGTQVPVERFAGRDGLGFSGTLAGAAFALAVSDAKCSDGMSDRRYPFTVTVLHGADTLRGCGWTDRHPFTAPAKP